MIETFTDIEAEIDPDDQPPTAGAGQIREVIANTPGPVPPGWVLRAIIDVDAATGLVFEVFKDGAPVYTHMVRLGAGQFVNGQLTVKGAIEFLSGLKDAMTHVPAGVTPQFLCYVNFVVTLAILVAFLTPTLARAAIPNTVRALENNADECGKIAAWVDRAVKPPPCNRDWFGNPVALSCRECWALYDIQFPSDRDIAICGDAIAQGTRNAIVSELRELVETRIATCGGRVGGYGTRPHGQLIYDGLLPSVDMVCPY